jgi:hypothetical protein
MKSIHKILPVVAFASCLTLNAQAAGSLLVGPDPVAKTPRHLGYNAELLSFFNDSNMADWMVDSNGTMCRIFVSKGFTKGEFDSIKTEEDFNRYRASMRANPDQAINWVANQPVVKGKKPDRTEDMCRLMLETKIEPLVDVAVGGKSNYKEPILVDLKKTVEAPQNINWAAAAAAYESHFAVFYRLGKIGVRYYMMTNEPEYGWKSFYYPADVDPEKLAWNARGEYVGRQLGAIAKFGRYALEDVQTLIKPRDDGQKFVFAGPGAHTSWETFWKYVSPYVDILDSHCYEADGGIFSAVQDRMAMRSGTKSLSLSEFNLVSGPMVPFNSMFTNESALALGDVLQSILKSTALNEPHMEFATLYLFNYPATHRMFKSLVYGEYDAIDAAGFIQQSPVGATLETMQIRTATLSYFVYKMMARCFPGTQSTLTSYEVLPLGISTLGFAQAVDTRNSRSIYLKLENDKYYANGGSGNEYEMSAIRTPDRLYINIINPGPGTNKDVEIDLELQPKAYKFAVVRETSEIKRDEVVAVIPVKDKKFKVEIPGNSLMQVILVDLDLDKIQNLTLEEKTFTPGTLAQMSRFETTRLKAYGEIDGKKVDLSELNIEWKSSVPVLVRAYSGGLVQKYYETSKDVVVTASVFNSKVSAEAKVAASKQASKDTEADLQKVDVSQDKMIQEQAKKPKN